MIEQGAITFADRFGFPNKIRKQIQVVAVDINCHHLDLFADFVRKAKAIREGDGALLDHSMFLYGSRNSDGNSHVHETLPVVMAGRGDGTLNPGRHIVYPETPM